MTLKLAEQHVLMRLTMFSTQKALSTTQRGKAYLGATYNISDTVEVICDFGNGS
jgi:hypothetical protein